MDEAWLEHMKQIQEHSGSDPLGLRSFWNLQIHVRCLLPRNHSHRRQVPQKVLRRSQPGKNFHILLRNFRNLETLRRDDHRNHRGVVDEAEELVGVGAKDSRVVDNQGAVEELGQEDTMGGKV